MSTKSIWESRVSKALRAKTAYCFKPVDSAMYGGQPRVDFIFVTQRGLGGLCEVKYTRPGSRGFNLMSEDFITPGQKAALQAVANTRQGISLLAVGRGTGELFIYDWRVWGSSPLSPDGHVRFPISISTVGLPGIQRIAFSNKTWPAGAFSPWLL